MNASVSADTSLRTVIRRAHLRMAWVAIALAGALLLLVGLTVLRFYIANNLELMARSVAYTVEASLVFSDQAEARRVLQDMLSAENIAEAQVIQADKKVFVRWTPPTTATFGKIGEALAIGIQLPQGRALIRQNNQVIGEVELRSDGSGLVRFLSAGFLVLLACLAISGYVGLRLSRKMLSDFAEPLQELMRVARAVRHERSMEQRVPPARIVELRVLGEDLNALIGELQLRHQRLKQQNSILTQQAMSDSLTGLANRAHFEQRLLQTLDEAAKSNQKLALLFIDADRFKEVNDRLGHAAGDTLLRTLGDHLRLAVRETDFVARLGGDEFAMLLYPLRNESDAQLVVEKMKGSMKQPIFITDKIELYVSVSVGIAIYPTHGTEMQTLLEYADRVMYQEKARNR